MNLTLIIRQSVIPDFRHRYCTCCLIVFKIIYLSGIICLDIRDIYIIRIPGSTPPVNLRLSSPAITWFCSTLSAASTVT